MSLVLGDATSALSFRTADTAEFLLGAQGGPSGLNRLTPETARAVLEVAAIAVQEDSGDPLPPRPDAQVVFWCTWSDPFNGHVDRAEHPHDQWLEAYTPAP